MPRYFQRKNEYDFLRRLREAASLSQREVAQTAGINPALLSYVECGYTCPTPRLVEAIKLAIAQLDSERRQRTDKALREAGEPA